MTDEDKPSRGDRTDPISSLKAELAAAREEFEKAQARIDEVCRYNGRLITLAQDQGCRAVAAESALAAERVANAGLREAVESMREARDAYVAETGGIENLLEAVDAALSAASPNAPTTEKQKDLGALRAASVETCVWFVDAEERCGAPATWRLEPVSDESHDELSGADGGGGMPPLRFCDRHFGSSRRHKNTKHWAAERIPATASVPPAAAPQEVDKSMFTWLGKNYHGMRSPAPQEQQEAAARSTVETRLMRGEDVRLDTYRDNEFQVTATHIPTGTVSSQHRHASALRARAAALTDLRTKLASAASEPKAPPSAPAAAPAPIVRGEGK